MNYAAITKKFHHKKFLVASLSKGFDALKIQNNDESQKSAEITKIFGAICYAA